MSAAVPPPARPIWRPSATRAHPEAEIAFAALLGLRRVQHPQLLSPVVRPAAGSEIFHPGLRLAGLPE